MNKKTALKSLKYIASLLFAFLILYLLFNNQDPKEMIKEMQQADIKWLILSMIFGGWAYVNRGLRWVVILNSLGYKSSKLNSISSVSIGYLTNLLIPRAGELSRCTALNQAEKIPINKLFGTILVERVLDFICLILLIFLILILKSNEILDFYNTLLSHQIEKNGTQTFTLFCSIILACILFFYFIKRWGKKTILYQKTAEFIIGIGEGFKSIKEMKYNSLFWFHSISIWVMYFLMTYVCFFSMQETSHLTVSDGFFLLALGGIGMVIPTPGGIGSYHAIVMIGLAFLGVGNVFLGEGGDPTNPALIFPTMVHLAQTLVAIIMGLIALLILFLSKKRKDEASS